MHFFQMTQRVSVAVQDTEVYAVVTASASSVALKIAQDYAVDIAVEETETKVKVIHTICVCLKSFL